MFFAGLLVIVAVVLVVIVSARPARTYVPDGTKPVAPSVIQPPPSQCAPPLVPTKDPNGVLDWMLKSMVAKNWTMLQTEFRKALPSTVDVNVGQDGKLLRRAVAYNVSLGQLMIDPEQIGCLQLSVEQLKSPPNDLPPAGFGQAYIGVDLSVPQGSIHCVGRVHGSVTYFPKPSYTTRYSARGNFSMKVGQLVLLVDVLQLKADPSKAVWNRAVPFSLDILDIPDIGFACPKSAKRVQDLVQFDICECMEGKVKGFLNAPD